MAREKNTGGRGIDCIIIGLLIITLLGVLLMRSTSWRFMPREVSRRAVIGWAHRTDEFYGEAVQALIAESQQRGTTTVLLEVEENVSDYICTSPCNKGLAEAFQSQSQGTTPPVRLAFRDKLVPVSGASEYCIVRRLNRCWYELDQDGNRRRCESDPEQTPNRLRAWIRITDVTLRPAAAGNGFTAAFQLDVEADGGGRKTVFQGTYVGDGEQIRWFIRSRPATWFGWATLGVFIVLGVMFRISRKSKEANANPVADLGLAIGLGGAFILLVYLYLAPLPRQRVYFYDQATLHYVVDINSEMYIPSDADGQVGIPYFAHALGTRLDNDVVWNSRKLALEHFWVWLAEKRDLVTLLRPEEYKLNQPMVLDVHTFCGHEKATWNTSGLEQLRQFVTDSDFRQLGLPADREGRLLCPQEQFQDEVRELAESSPRSPPTFVIMLTSSSAPCREDVRNYLRAHAVAQQQCGRRLKVFTIYVPTLPRTGGQSAVSVMRDRPVLAPPETPREDCEPLLYDFEDGKAALGCVVSDRVLVLHQPPAAEWNYVESRARRLSGRLSGPSPLSRLNLPTGLFPELVDTSSRNPATHDVPRDLAPDRRRQLTDTPARFDAASRTVAERIDRFISETYPRTAVRSAHVAGHPWPITGVMIGLFSLLGYFCFAEQYNASYLGRFRDRSSVKIVHHGAPVVLLVAILGSLLVITWCSECPELWTAIGDPRWALAMGLACWLTWCLMPHLRFAARCKGQDHKPATRCARRAVVRTGIIVAGLEVAAAYGGPTWRFCAGWLGILFLLSCLWLWPRWFRRENHFGDSQNHPWDSQGVPDWWRTPYWSGLVKMLLILILVVLARGAFPAGETKIPGAFGKLAAWLPYERFVVLGAIVFSIVAVGICLTDKRKLFSFLCALPIALYFVGSLSQFPFQRNTGFPIVVLVIILVPIIVVRYRLMSPGSGVPRRGSY